MQIVMLTITELNEQIIDKINNLCETVCYF